MRRSPLALGVGIVGGVVLLCLTPLLAQQARRTTRPTAPKPTANPEVSAAPVVDGYKSIARPFLDRYCVSCHAGEKAKGTFRADGSLTADFTDRANQAEWAEAINQLNSHLMPPK